MKTELKSKMLEAIYLKTGGRNENPSIVEICVNIAVDYIKTHQKSIERAKIEATKCLKVVIDTRLHEYEKAEKNGRCDECDEPLTYLEAKDGTTCKDCLYPE